MYLRSFISLSLLLFAVQHGNAQSIPRTICNPINISYRFSLDTPSRREAADPSVVNFKGKFYLFASKSGGYWHSHELKTWEFIKTDDLPLEDYAPTVAVIDDTLYFTASSSKATLAIYKTADPKSGKWIVANPAVAIKPVVDPCLFADDDRRIYLYYGCSDVNPIYAVELDRKTLNPVGDPVPLINSHKETYGWERPGDYNDIMANPWIEGSWMTKRNGKYYLQYAGPGTQYKSYCDAVYIADKPLGPFVLAPNNPFSSKPEGFIAGAGHSSTFADNYGNYWHISTMTISKKHMFERRIGIFPAFFDRDGDLYTNITFGDFPYIVPDKKITRAADIFPGWMLLSYRKPVFVSSSAVGHAADLASDEEIRTYWSAETGKKGEWLMMDLEHISTIRAIQVNFAENGTVLHGRDSDNYYQYQLEYSADKRTWRNMVDKRHNHTDAPHDYTELPVPLKARYIRLTNYHVPSGTFAISDLRVFGTYGDLPAESSKLVVKRNEKDRCVADLSWKKVKNAIGYNIRYGTSPGKLYHTYQVLGKTQLKISSLNQSESYYFAIDVFNEKGVLPGKHLVKAN